jgi:hypothetical protein
VIDYHYAVVGNGYGRSDKPAVVRVKVISRGAVEARVVSGAASGYRRRMSIAHIVDSADAATAQWRSLLEKRVKDFREEADRLQSLLDGPTPKLVKEAGQK